MVVILILQLPVQAANTFPSVYDVVSVNNTDGKGVNAEARVSAISVDGNKILYTTNATNLDNASTTPSSGGYMRDVQAGTTLRIDVSESNVLPDASNTNFVMSETGRYVAFNSVATNLIDGATQTPNVSRLYLKDVQTGELRLLTTNAGYIKSISNDGRYIVAYTTDVNTILPGTRSGGSGYGDSLLYDTHTDTWTLLNIPHTGALQDKYSSVDSTSCDGSLMVMSSNATNLVDNYSGSGWHIYLVDIRNGITITDLTPGATLDTISVSHRISCNGRYIVYSTRDRTNVSPTPSGMDSYAHLVRYDRITGERMYVDSASNNTTFDQYQSTSIPSSVADTGDVVLAWGSSTSTTSRKVYFKHLSDGSGTLESVQHNYAGLSYEAQFNPTFAVSSNGKYLAVSSKSGYALGLNIAQYDYTPNILRIKTGL